MTETKFDIPATKSLAERLLTDYFEYDITLTTGQQFDSPHLVLRCTIDNPIDGVPKSVILKQLPFDQSERKAMPDALFRNEWACLQFLSAISQNVNLAPRLYTGDREAQLMIMEDLGDYPSIQDDLYDTDALTSVSALVRYGTCLGYLHGQCAGKEDQFNAIRAEFNAETPASDSTVDMQAIFGTIHESLMAYDITTSEAFKTEVYAIGEMMQGENSLFRTFVHSDSGAHNVINMGERVSLLDFEYGQFAHGFLDLASARLGFPHSFQGMSTPVAVIEKLESAYRESLADYIPEVNDDAVFYAHLVDACAYWTMGRMTLILGYLKNYAEHGEAVNEQMGHISENMAKLFGQPSTLRALWRLRGVLSLMESFLQLADQHLLRPACCEVVRQVRMIFLDMLPDTKPLPFYPTFRA